MSNKCKKIDKPNKLTCGGEYKGSFEVYSTHKWNEKHSKKK